MPRSLRASLLVGVLLSPCLAASSPAGQAANPSSTPAILSTAPAAPGRPGAIDPLRMEKAERQALQEELAQRVEQTRKEVAALQARHDATTDFALRRALQQWIEAAKREQWLDFFRIQLRYAQAARRLEQVKELEAVLEARMKLPVAPLPPLAPSVPPGVAAGPARPVKGGGQ